LVVCSASAGRGGMGQEPGCLEANLNIHIQALALCSWSAAATKGEGRLIGCFMNESRRYDTTS